MNRYQDKIGSFVHIPNVGRGQLKYIGPVDTKPGIYVGVDLLANIGKNDGSFKNKRYFNTEYPQSGLFIQLPKIASLLDDAQPAGSRRSTMAPESTFDTATFAGNRISSSESTGSTVIRRQISSNPLSPTPIRGSTFNSVSRSDSQLRMCKQRVISKSGSPRELHGRVDHEGDVDMVPPSSVVSHRTSFEDVASSVRKRYELKIEKQDKEISQFKRLLDDQRIVLEEIQPTIDQYESSLRDMENELNTLRQQLKMEQEQHHKQKEFFENEHEQLLAVVEELHEEIKANEERVMVSQSKQSNGSESPAQLKKTIIELLEKVEYLERAQLKWSKEKEQLRLQNESLSKEYSSLNRELLRAQAGRAGSDSNTDTQALEEKLHNANVKIAQLEDLLKHQIHMRSPTYRDDTVTLNSRSDTMESLPSLRSKTKLEAPPSKDLWCALCERDGHQSMECPYELPLASEGPEELQSPSKNELL